MKGYSSNYGYPCELEIVPSLNKEWITIKDDCGASVTVEIKVLLEVIGEQADILHHLLTEQTAKAEIRKEVEPQGEWNHVDKAIRYLNLEWECNQCHERHEYITKYCPNCGCRMIEPQESEK